MDVRCEKCQTEYELDEARLKPGGVTVKCTNCGHMFKIRKRAPTNVGAGPASATPLVAEPARARQPSGAAPSVAEPARARAPSGGPGSSESLFDEAPTSRANPDGPTTVERQWQIRLENGEQKSCRELTVLQQWIVSGVITRESLISRTGKTWKRLGDIAELARYFDVADEARTTRESRAVSPRAKPAATPAQGAAPQPRGTMLGLGAAAAAQAAGGTILPDDDDRAGRGGSLPPKVPPGAKTPPFGSVVAAPSGPPSGPPSGATPRRMEPTPPPIPARRMEPTPPPIPAVRRTPAGPVPVVRTPGSASTPPPSVAGGRVHQPTPPPPIPSANRPPTPIPVVGGRVHQSTPPPVPTAARRTTPPPMPAVVGHEGRSTAAWASEPVRPVASSELAGPVVGKLAAIPDEPAFAGSRVRPLDPEPGFTAGRKSGAGAPDARRDDDEDDELLPRRRGSRAGLWIALALLVLGGAAGAAIYVFVIKDRGAERTAVTPAPDARSAEPPDAAAVVTAIVDAPPEPPVSPLDAPRGELLADLEPRLRTAFESLAAKDDAAAQAVRANLGAALAQALTDRAGLVADRAEADKLRREAGRLALDAAAAAQRALKDAPDDAGANVGMAAVLRLQGKPAASIKRYSDAARARSDKAWARDVALADALVLARDGKLEDARAALAAIDQGDDRLEASNDVRARFHLALIAQAQGKPADAKALVDQILAAQPEHVAARALAGKLEAVVAKTDPLPPEDPRGNGSGSGSGASPRPPPDGVPSGGGDADKLVARADALADSNCAAAMPLYSKALEQKSNHIGALTGMGYCHIDAKQFASAFGKFRAALAVSPRYEPALWGIAEAYQQQGRKDQAIEAFQHYLEIYPGTAKALRQLERLGGAPGGAPAGGSGGAGAGSSAAPPPTPPPATPPPATPPPATPPPAPAESGAG